MNLLKLFSKDKKDNLNKGITGKSLETEQIKANGGYVSVRTYAKQSIYTDLDAKRLAEILLSLKEGNSREFLILAEEFEEKDLHYISTLSVRKRALITTPPTLITENINNSKVKDLITEFINQPFFSNLIMDLLDAISKGFSICEMSWYDNKVLGYKHLPAYWFDYDKLGNLKIYDDLGLELLPIVENGNNNYFNKKFILHEPKLKSGLQGRSGLALPACVYMLYKACALQNFQAFAEVFGMPLRVGTYDNTGNMSPEDLKILKKAVKNLGTDAAAVIPKSMQIDFHEVNKGDGAGLYGKLLDYLDKQISKLLLGQTMTTDHGGSMAQAKVHNDIRLDIVKSDARELEVTINRFIRNYIDQAVGVQAVYPRLRWDIEEEENKKDLAVILNNLKGTNLQISKSDIIRRFGFLPADVSNKEDILDLSAVLPSSKGNNQTANNNLSMNSASKKDGLSVLQDKIVNENNYEEAEKELLTPILDIIKDAKNYDEVQERLSKVKLSSKILLNTVQELNTASSIIGDQKDNV